MSVSCVLTDVLERAETSPTESLQCLDMCLLMSYVCLLKGLKDMSRQRHGQLSPHSYEILSDLQWSETPRRYTN
jgi:hypothetical protein